MYHVKATGKRTKGAAIANATIPYHSIALTSSPFILVQLDINHQSILLLSHLLKPGAIELLPFLKIINYLFSGIKCAIFLA